MISKNKIKYIHSLELKKNRKSEGVFVAEGRKLVEDLLPYIECIYMCKTEDCMLSAKCGCQVDIVTQEELRHVSFQETPQQVLAIFRQPQYSIDIRKEATGNLVIALDDVQNPGNLGTIMRLADWFGIEHILCSKGCADVYNPKTVQATMGALARVKVHYCNLTEEFEKLGGEVPIYGTFLDGENIYSSDFQKCGIIVMGNEGNGISAQVGQFVNKKLLIPNYPEGRKTSESLNVAIATAIVCSEFRRRS